MRDFDWKILSTLYRTRNITKTAELLFITQPTLTRRLQQIEAELGAVLIIRSNKGVTFTPEGKYIASKSAEIYQAMEDIKSAVSKNSSSLSGTLRLGAPNSYVQFKIPALIEAFSRQYPEIHIDIHTRLSHELLRDLETRELDVSLVRGDFNTSLEKELLSRDQACIISKTSLDFKELPALPQIAYPKETSVTKATRRWWKERFQEPPLIRYQVGSGEACLQFIKRGLGYGIFSDLQYYDPADGLYAYPLEYADGSKFTRDSWLVYDRADLHNPLLSHFVSFVKENRSKLWSTPS